MDLGQMQVKVDNKEYTDFDQLLVSYKKHVRESTAQAIFRMTYERSLRLPKRSIPKVPSHTSTRTKS